MKTIQETLLLSAEFLSKKGILNARREAEQIVSEALEMPRLDLYLAFDRPVDEKELERCRGLLSRRGKGEPFQYIKGNVDFFGCELKVTPAVLIPRNETEILVEIISNNLLNYPPEFLEHKTLWDVCCGSGCIGIALKKKYPQLNVILSDVSPAALEIAKENAHQNQVDVQFLLGDLFEPFNFKGLKCDFLACNPPYISNAEYQNLEREVKEFEPKIALIGGEEGILFYQRIAEELSHVLNPKGKAWLEIGYQQGKVLLQLFEAKGWTHCSIQKDWAGHDRFFSLENE